MYLTPFDTSQEPNQNNIRQWLESVFTRSKTIEQCRWNNSNTDSLFYAGSQSFVNSYFGYNANASSFGQYYFNLIQQPVNMVTGYQRQNRKGLTYVPFEGADPHTTDQYTRLTTHNCNVEGIHEQFSKACELAAVSGKVLLQPYLDYTGDDQAQGELKVKIWEFNSFLVDPYYRNPDMSDCQFVWCQEYISKGEARSRFPDHIDLVNTTTGISPQYGDFYFLPENHNMARNDMLVVSYVWYKSKRRKKRLYSKSRNQFFDFAGGDGQLEAILYSIKDLEEVNVEVPTWKVCVVLNDQLVFQGDNPLGFDKCPFVSVDWNYEPHMNDPNLRVRSMVTAMRSPQFLFNWKVINNNDIAAATINAGWKRKIGAVANEDNLKKSNNGFDVLINEGYEMTDCEKIIPSAVPQSDLELANQMAELVVRVCGIDIENWSGQNDKQISSLTAMIKQAANLMVFQKYFDQWDHSFKLLGELLLLIPLNNWNAQKVALILGEEPSPHFYSKVFAKYQVVVEPGLLTPTQKNMQAQQLLEINERFGREVFPPSMIIKDMNLQGRAEAMEYLQQQEQQQSQMAQEEQVMQHAFENAKLQEMMSKATTNIATARERMGRSESNIGLFEERLSMISRNRALATKDKMDALAKLLESIQKFGEIETYLKENQLDSMEDELEMSEDREKIDAKTTAESNKFLEQIMGQMGQQQQQQMPMESQESLV